MDGAHFLGVETRSTSFIRGTKTEIYKTSFQNTTLVTKERAFMRQKLDDIKISYYDLLDKHRGEHSQTHSN